jgi:DNA invertase Pin-like site-specific DNA recombinase
MTAVAEIERENIIEQTMNGRRKKQGREVGMAVLPHTGII